MIAVAVLKSIPKDLSVHVKNGMHEIILQEKISR